jgi:hypothetical protein
VDLLAIPIDKNSDHFSPTTRYRGYAISPSLLHRENQSTTKGSCPNGRRYQNHGGMGTTVLPMVHLTPEERVF